MGFGFRPCLAIASSLALTAPSPGFQSATQAAELAGSGLDQLLLAHQSAGITASDDQQRSEWNSTALQTLLARQGCQALSIDDHFNGQPSLNRDQAAAMLYGCLNQILEITAELQPIIRELAPELTTLRQSVDRAQATLRMLEASEFSTTTKLKGLATFVAGANQFSGSAISVASNTFISGKMASNGKSSLFRYPLPNATTFNYNVDFTLDTSFTGKDLLRTNLRSGNFARSVFGGTPHELSLAELEAAFEEDCGEADCGDVLAIDKLFYQWPLGSGFVATIGPRVGQEDMLALWPNVYPSDTILNVMTVNGAPAAYNKNRGAGGGIWWQRDRFSVSANYVATQGDQGKPEQGGLAASHSGSTASVQLAYAGVQWGVAALWSLVQANTEFVPGTTPATHEGIDHTTGARTNATAISGYWQPMRSGWLPSLSVGWGYNQTSTGFAQPAGSLRKSQSWMVGLQWTDVLAKGNDFGFAVAQPVFATATSGNTTPNDGNFVWEWWYKLQISDHITMTPALIYLSRPLGEHTPVGTSFSQLGGLLKTSLRF